MNAVYWIWGTTLAIITFVVVPLALHLLHRTLKAAMSIERYARESLTAGWNVARDAVVPLVEDAAERAGGYLAERAPEVIRDVVVPKFIAGFEQARDSSSGGTKEAA